MLAPIEQKPWWEGESLDPCSQEKQPGRIWHHYRKWEDAKAGMYKTISGNIRSILLENAVDFTGDYSLCGEWMRKVVEMWPISCEHNLSATSVNRRAWVGHAACCLAIGVPEDITRESWRYLSARKKKLANNEADIAINIWEKSRGKDAKNTIREKCSGCGKGAHIRNIRPVQQDIFEFLRRQGFYRNAALGCR